MPDEQTAANALEPGYYPVRFGNGWDNAIVEFDGLNWFMAGREDPIRPELIVWTGPRIEASWGGGGGDGGGSSDLLTADAGLHNPPEDLSSDEWVIRLEEENERDGLRGRTTVGGEISAAESRRRQDSDILAQRAFICAVAVPFTLLLVCCDRGDPELSIKGRFLGALEMLQAMWKGESMG